MVNGCESLGNTIVCNTDSVTESQMHDLPTIYLSGPMTGYENFNQGAFNTAADALRSQGYTVHNPAENDGGSHDKGWVYYMHLDIHNVINSDILVMLPGWEDSKGATIEVANAVWLDKPIYRIEEFLRKGTASSQIEPIVGDFPAKMQPKASGGKKYDQDKIRLDLIPVSIFTALGAVLSFGAKKYADRNWEQGFKWSRVYGAMLRHLVAWYGGEDRDPESGLSHLDHALCNMTFLKEFEKTHPELDDRVKS